MPSDPSRDPTELLPLPQPKHPEPRPASPAAAAIGWSEGGVPEKVGAHLAWADAEPARRAAVERSGSGIGGTTGLAARARG